MRVILAGTPDFAADVFKTVVEEGKHEVCAVLSGPLKKGDRGRLVQPPAAFFAQKRDIPLLQFEKVSKEGVSALKALNADIMVTAAFGQILSDEVINIFPHGVINAHGSLLPKYRGAAPIQYALMCGEEKTGITVMRTVREVDAGDILLKKEIAIEKNDTSGTLFEKMGKLGGAAICEALLLIESGKAAFTPQNHNGATFTKPIKKEDAKIDFSKTARELDCFVRAMSPKPGAFTFYDKKMLKIYSLTSAPLNNIINKCKFGEVLAADAKSGLIVWVGAGAVEILELQAEGGKKMPARDYLKGHRVEVGTCMT